VQIALVKSALRDAVIAAEIPGLDVYAYVPDAPSVPCFYPGEVTLDPLQTFGPGSDNADIICRVLVSAADDADGQALLDQYLSRSGTHSIRAAISAARGAPGELALGGAADDLVITKIDGYRLIATPNQELFYGAQITVRVIGSEEA
jgi:hypothetical protein